MSITTGILRGGTNNHETTSEEANAIATDFIAEGIVDAVGNTSGVAPMTGGYSVAAQGTPDMTVAVSSGVAYVEGTPSSQNAQVFRVKNSASENVTISANSSGSTKYDWLYISLNATNLNDPNSAADNVATLTTSRSSSASTDDGTPPTYGYPLAVITVANGATSITNSMIRDVRVQAAVSAGASTSASTWTDTGYAPGTVTYNGNRSYSLVFSNTDLTGFLSNGMRLKLTRTVTPPTQCTDLEAGSSQYWSKTSPSGISFTTAYTLAAWIKVESYAASGFIIAKNSVAGTNGFRLFVNTSGQLTIDGFLSAGNSKIYTSYQSLPTGKWVHVAATMDMASAGGVLYIDGVQVPSFSAGSGTATTLTQAGNLYIGTQVGTTSYFDGKIAQASVHNAILTANQIRDMASQTISSSSPSIVSGFTFNGAATDVTANANDLTASGGATYGTDSPMNATEYGIITANSFSTNTTLTVQVPEGYSIPTSGGVSSVFYSTQHTPYGFPANRGKWKIESMYLANLSQSAPVTGTWYSLNTRITVPTGAWTGTYMANVYGDNGGTPTDVQISMGTSSNSEQDSYMTYRCFENSATSGIWPVNKSREYNLTSATDHYIVATETSGILNTLQLHGADGATVIRFELAYI